MRTIIDIPNEQLPYLAKLCEAEKISRAELIRRALAQYLDQRVNQPVDAFALWKDRNIDGVEYQRNLRAEWE